MYTQDELFVKVSLLKKIVPATQWKVISFCLFGILLLPFFEAILPFIYPLLYLNEIHIFSNWNGFFSFIILVLMINLSFWLFYLGKMFIYEYLNFNKKLFSIIFTIGFIYYIMYLFMSLVRLFQVAYSII